MRIGKLAIVLLALLPGYTNIAAAADECTCLGTQTPMSFNGGNNKPLSWNFAPYQVSSGTSSTEALFCFFKQVENHGNNEVHDVYWRVADYYRMVMGTGSRSSCHYYPGPLASTPTNGPLQYGTSSNGYDTTVILPKSGWAKKSGAVKVPRKINEWPTIKTQLQFDIENADGIVKTAGIEISNYVKGNETTKTLGYDIKNISDESFSILLNAASEAAIAPIQKPLDLKPNEQKSITIDAEGNPTLEPAAIVIFDEKGRVAAMETGGFYTVSEKKENDDSYYWNMIR